METEIQNKMLFSTSYSTRDVGNSLGNHIRGLCNGHNKAFTTDQYQNSLLKRQVIGGYSEYEKEQMRQIILKHELVFKNQLEELHRLYKRQRDLMNEIKRRVFYPPPELPFANRSFITPPISEKNTHNSQSPLSFTKRDITSSPFISRERVISRECEYPEPKHNKFQQSFLNNMSMSIGSRNDLKANFCSRRVDDVFDLNEPVQVEESNMKHMNNKNEAGESILLVKNCRVDEPSPNKSDIETREKRTIFGVEIFQENDNKNGTRVLPMNNKKIFGFCIVPNSNDREGFEVNPTSKSLDLASEKGLNSNISNLKLQIDLNLSINEVENSLILPLPETIVKIATTEIDLEAPFVVESETDLSPKSTYPEKIILEIIKKNEESKEQHEELNKEAAEAIISMSLSSDIIQDTTNSDPLSHSCDDILRWFANLVSCHNGDEISEEYRDGMDYFEYLTLNLKETNIEEYVDKSPMYLDPDKVKGDTVVLSKRPKRGQGKRGKQKKDFQRDVLPGIVSLSRHEVAEDLHSFQELFKACGFVWQPTVSKRSNGKRGRGRRRLGSYCTKEIHTKEIHVCEQVGVSGEAALEEAAVTGWGKRMRRLPRRRCQVGVHT